MKKKKKNEILYSVSQLSQFTLSENIFPTLYVPIDFVCAVWSDVCMVVICLLKAFALSMSVMVVLVPKRMLLFCCVGCFCWIALLWCPTGSVDCVCDQFCQDVVSKFLVLRSCICLFM